MEYKKEKVLNITLKDNEIDSFRSIIKKLKDEDKKIGFKQKVFNDEENKLLSDINKAIK